MSDKTMKNLLEMEFFPTNDAGQQLVPNEFGDVTIIEYDLPGDYPIIGIGPSGYVAQFDEDGVLRRDCPSEHAGAEDPFYIPYSAWMANSLIMPEKTLVTKFILVDADGMVEGTFDEREDAEACSWAGNQIIEVDGYGYVRSIDDAETDEEPSPFIVADLDRQDEAAATKAAIEETVRLSHSFPLVFPFSRLLGG